MKNKIGFIGGLFCLGYALSAAAVNINTAAAADIAKDLKGVGLAKAGAIVLYREQNGAFKTLKDISKVKGIGAITVDKNRTNIQLSD